MQYCENRTDEKHRNTIRVHGQGRALHMIQGRGNICRSEFRPPPPPLHTPRTRDTSESPQLVFSNFVSVFEFKRRVRRRTRRPAETSTWWRGRGFRVLVAFFASAENQITFVKRVNFHRRTPPYTTNFHRSNTFENISI